MCNVICTNNIRNNLILRDNLSYIFIEFNVKEIQFRCQIVLIYYNICKILEHAYKLIACDVLWFFNELCVSNNNDDTNFAGVKKF